MLICSNNIKLLVNSVFLNRRISYFRFKFYLLMYVHPKLLKLTWSFILIINLLLSHSHSLYKIIFLISYRNDEETKENVNLYVSKVN